MKILWLTFIPSPYRLKFFEELSKYCELTVLFERANSPIRKGRWNQFLFNNYTGLVLKGIPVGKYDKLCLGVYKYLNKKYDVVVISNATSPTAIYAAGMLRLKHIPYYVEGDGAFPSDCGKIKLYLKKFVNAHAIGCFSTAKLHDDYYKQSGVDEEKLFRYPFTSIGKADIDRAKSFASQEFSESMSSIERRNGQRQIARKQLGINEKKIILSIGQFIHRKGFDILLQSAKGLNGDIGLYIIGDKPIQEYISLKEQVHNISVHFLDFMSKEELSYYFQAADIFVLPTRYDVWGLVINEAMAHALPIITTNMCVAGLELVSPTEGFIVPADNKQQLQEKIQWLIDNESEAERMGNNAQNKIEEYTYEKMAERHIEVFNSVEV